MFRQNIFEKERIHINVARLKKSGHVFEIDIDPDLALAYKSGKAVALHDVLKVQKIFTDAKKGLRANEHVMSEVFSTAEPLEVAKIILQNGEIQLTAQHREKLIQDKRRKLMEIIHRNAIDSRTNLPVPMARLENAMRSAKIMISPFKSAEQQVDDVLKKLHAVLPISFSVKEIELAVGREYSQNVHASLQSFGRILKEQWHEGALSCVVEIPAGIEEDFFNRLNSLTHGNMQSKIVKKK